MKTKIGFVVGLLLILGLGLSQSLVVTAQCVPLEFEDLPDGTMVTTQYHGVTFSAPGPGKCSGHAVIRDMSSLGGTYSGTQALSTAPGFACEFSPEYLQMVFDHTQREVSFFVGPGCGRYVINAYDISNHLIDTQTVVILDCKVWHGVHRFVMVDSPVRNIKRITINAGDGVAESIDNLLFGADRTPPIARIDAPGWGDCGCNPIEILGEACEPDGVFDAFYLEYQPANNPAAPWQLINKSTTSACGGLLGLWNTTGVAHGYYHVRLTVFNVCGLSSMAQTIVYVDKIFNTLDFRYPTDGAVIRGDHVCIDGTVWDNWCFDSYTVQFKPAVGGVWKPVEPLSPVYTSTVINDPFAHWNTNVISDGKYKIKVDAQDVCGNAATEIHNVLVDNTPPQAEILEPHSCTVVNGIVPDVGIANDNYAVSSWILQFTGGPFHTWVTIASGTSPVLADVLGIWDTTALPFCAYTLRLRVWDEARHNCSTPPLYNHTEHMVSVIVGPTDLSADLDHDGDVDLKDFAIFAQQWLVGT